MADYTSKYYGAEIDSAVGTALALKDLRGIIKITADGPVAAVANEDYIADSSSIVNVAGILKGVADAETGKIVVHKAEAGIDYQTPLKAGIDYATPTAVANKQNKITAQGLLKGLGDGNVVVAEAGVDYQAPIPVGTYATPDDAKPFVVTFTLGVDNTVTADKTAAEVHAALDAKRNVIGLISNAPYVFTPMMYSHDEEEGYVYDVITFMCLIGSEIFMIQFTNEMASFMTASLQMSPDEASSLPASGTALTANTIYAVADAVGTYAFTPPSSGWAHGKFTTGASVSVSFSGTFVGAAPTIEASKTYEFDVLNGVWAVQEVVSA